MILCNTCIKLHTYDEATHILPSGKGAHSSVVRKNISEFIINHEKQQQLTIAISHGSVSLCHIVPE